MRDQAGEPLYVGSFVGDGQDYIRILLDFFNRNDILRNDWVIFGVEAEYRYFDAAYIIFAPDSLELSYILPCRGLQGK